MVLFYYMGKIKTNLQFRYPYSFDDIDSFIDRLAIIGYRGLFFLSWEDVKERCRNVLKWNYLGTPKLLS